MGFWCRINQSNLRHLNRHLKRCYLRAPSLNSTSTHPRSCVVDNPFSSSVNRPPHFCNNVRFFAASVQYQKKEEKDENGPRLNHQIPAQYIRLVMEEGHKVVSRHEALELARELKLDLVEVDRKADPPVCKIMDFHKEKYKKELQEKDRAKSKSEVTLKKGGCKEVRFSGKIEQKDLKIKADTIKRLIERGYRVKCLALPMGKKDDQEDLGGYLSRLLALIEDTSVVESGPHVERKQAYVIIRHVKFGPKKGGGKKSKASTLLPSIDPSGDMFGPAVSEEDPAELGLENEDITLDDEIDLPMSPPMEMRARNISNSSNNFNKDKLPSPPLQTSHGAENRYKRSEPRNQFPPVRPMGGRGPGMSNPVRSGPSQFPNQRRQPPPNMNVSPAMAETKPVGTHASVFRNTSHPNNMPNQGQSRPGFGIFSTPKANASGRQNAPANFHRNEGGRPHTSARNPGSAGAGANPNFPASNSDGGQRPGTDNEGQKKFGIFSK